MFTGEVGWFTVDGGAEGTCESGCAGDEYGG